MSERRIRSPWLVGLTVVVACASGGEQSEQRTASPVTDAEIAGIVVAANTIDAEAGDIAARRAASAEVRAFGQTMATDHRAVNEQARALVAKLGVVPVASALSEKLQSDAATFQAELAKESGGDFDRSYIAHEVVYHRAVIDALDQLLIPSARNAELKQTLIAVRPAFVAHLRHAEHLEQSLR
jgi:putative membrane protein